MGLGADIATALKALPAADKLDIDKCWEAIGDEIEEYIGDAQPAGAITMSGEATAPTGFLLCDGSAVSRTTYADLFTAIGTTFGVGDGSTTFNVPDLRGIFPRGAGTNGTLQQGRGGGNYFTATLGTLQNDQFQGHHHATINAPLLQRNTTTPSDNLGTTNTNVDRKSDVVGDAETGNHGTARIGYETRPPNLGVTFIIKT